MIIGIDLSLDYGTGKTLRLYTKYAVSVKSTVKYTDVKEKLNVHKQNDSIMYSLVVNIVKL